MGSKTSALKARLLKHWLPLSLGVLGLLLLGLLAAGSLLRSPAATPIARIEPEPRDQLPETPSRLERYRQEMEALQRQQARRKRSLETIVSLDFGQMGVEEPPLEAEGVSPSGAAPDSGATRPPVSPGEMSAARRREGAAPEKPLPGPTKERSRPLSPASQVGVSPTKASPTKASPTDPFYTVRAAEPSQQGPGQAGVYRVVVHGDQELAPNGTLTLRLLEELSLGPHRFPQHTLLYGKLSGSSGGRLKIRILSIGTVPLRLRVLDQDYEEGIQYMQREALPEALAESGDGALDQMLYTLPYGGVASGLAGLGRKLIRQRRKEQPIFLADGYPLFVTPEP